MGEKLENERIGGFQLNYQFYSGEDHYSDGEIEEEMLRVCREKRQEQALRESASWPMLYHLSPARENLLEWYDFAPDGSLLEIGAGCGALTGLFGRRLARVVCIELSRRRSLINAYKNGDRASAEIYVGNFEDIVLEETFDYVTLIGVLEYAKAYISGDRPFHTMLKRVGERLRPEGSLMIAIENKMGMKYFSGAAEDHTGRPYDGIQNYIGGSGAVTFSKPELEKLLTDCGYGDLTFYYPVPDYKLPASVYSDMYLPGKGELRNVKRAYAGVNLQMFDEEVAFDRVCEDGLFPYFSNSFLVIAKKR